MLTLPQIQETSRLRGNTPQADSMENNLHAYRKAAGLSQQAVADLFRTRYGKSTVSYQQVSD